MAIRTTLLTLAAVSAAALLPGIAQASSHREAPLLLEDPTVDATDLFAFRNGTNLDIIVNYIPFELASAGPNFYRFSDNAVYRINIDNNGDAIADIVYEFRFHTTVTDPTTFLYNTGPITTAGNLNVHQTYTVTRIVGTTSTDVTPATNAEVAPAFVGRASFIAPLVTPQAPASNAVVGDETSGENGAAQTAYDGYVAAHNIGALVGGGQVFAGPRDDPFFIDLGAIFDLLRIRPGAPGNVGGGVDHLAGLNVHSIALEVPIASVTSGAAVPTDIGAASSVIGIWTTAHRPRVHVLRGSTVSEYHGELVQVSRLGLPLVNEVLVPLAFKDFYLGSQPVNDLANYGGALTANLVTTLLNGLYGIGASQPSVFGDLQLLLTGGLIRGATPTGTAITLSDTLKINLAIAGSPFPAAGSTATLGALGADTAGFPNGRRLADDVTDIELRVLGGALEHNATGSLLGDGVNVNDVPFTAVFPYIARPHEGYAQVNGRLQPASAAR